MKIGLVFDIRLDPWFGCLDGVRCTIRGLVIGNQGQFVDWLVVLVMDVCRESVDGRGG